MQRSASAREVNDAPNEGPLFGPFMDDTYLDHMERRNKLLNEFYRDYTEHVLQLNSLRKRVSKIGKRSNQRIEDLGRRIHLISTIRRMKHTLHYMSDMRLKSVQTRRRLKWPIPRNTRIVLEESQDNLCRAVQEMQLNSENSVRRRECVQPGDNFLAKVDSPSDVAEDLSKLCMKD